MPRAQTRSALERRIANPRFLFLYAPLQYTPEEVIRPDSSLGIPYLHGAMTAAGYEAGLLDTSIGRPGRDELRDTFYRRTPLPEISPDHFRIGMTPERILEEVRDYDVIAVSSIFTQQTSRCFEISRLVKEAYPEKIMIAGGVNARSLRPHFFENGYDAIFLSESEKPVVEFARYLQHGTPSLESLPGVCLKLGDRVVTNNAQPATEDLDEYAMPSWKVLPNEQYWEISEPWGGKQGWLEGQKPRYASILTSRGCPYRCDYCHISKEKGDEAGGIGRLRFHSLERVWRELDLLHGMGVELIYINDDSFLAKKNRVRDVLSIMRNYNFLLADVNGVNIIHLYKRVGEQLVIDMELLESLYEAGFRRIGLPFESGSQRLLDKYSTSKWKMDKVDVLQLVRVMSDMGFTINGNFMVGYPDETLDELSQTYVLARRVMDAGLTGCGFFVVQPFPGTVLYDEAIASGQLDPGYTWDSMGWSKIKSPSPYRNLKIDPSVLNYSRNLVYALLNTDCRTDEWWKAFADLGGSAGEAA